MPEHVAGGVDSGKNGLKSAWRPINARAETVATSPMFKGARRPCLVPADAFYEWRKTTSGEQPYVVARADEPVMPLGGLREGRRSPEGEILRIFAHHHRAGQPRGR